jgi:hypothetical protein
MSGQLSRLAVGLALSAVIAGCGREGSPSRTTEAARPATPAGHTPSAGDAQVLADFNRRIDNYMELRNKLKKDAPPLKETKDPAKIKASQAVLGQKLREARQDAKQGDIFTLEIRQLFRRLMYPETKGREGAENKAIVTEEKHELKDVSLKVNAEYPDSAPLMTVPPDFLAALPKLPEDLEYRFVSKHMILLDVHANLIVDYILNAIR